MKTSFVRSFAALVLIALAGSAFAIDSKVASSMYHTVFVDNGNVYGMGLNNYRQTDPNATTIILNPATSTEAIRVPVYIGVQNVKSVTANGNRSAALKNDGTIVVWGNLTAKTWTKPYNPFLNDYPITDIALTTTALYSVMEGAVYSWAFTGEPVQVTSLNEGKVKSIAAGDRHLIVLFENGTVGTLGSNQNGQLGRGAITTAQVPFAKLALTNAVEVAANGNTSFVRTSDGQVYAFGKNTSGQLGLGHNVDQLVPVAIPNITNVKKITANYAATFLLMGDETVKASGWHNYIGGSLYNVSKTFQTIPAAIAVKALHSGGKQIFVDFGVVGQLRGWGGNAHGQLGDTTNIERHSPTFAHFTRYAAWTPPAPPAGETGTCGSIYSNPFGNASNSNNNGRPCQDNGNHNGAGNGRP